jgi:hypothetical protein
VSVLLTNAAGRPRAVSASTWSFMSEMSGLTTTVSPGSTRAGTWKQSDFPPPVGMITIVSRPSSTASTACSCPGRNAS